MTNVTNILGQIEEGDPSAGEKLLPLVYDELRKLAAARMAEERPDHTLQPTDLVHEAYLRLVGDARARKWNSRGHFFGAAAEAMRRILVEQYRRKASLKAGGDWQRITLSQVEPTEENPTIDLISLDEALSKLEQISPRKAKLVKLRYFAGLTIQQAAELLGIAASTADEDWAYARSWLKLEMVGEQ